MASFETSPRPRLLIVSDLHDETFCAGVEELRAAGAAIQMAPDVYTALACLATGEKNLRVVLDVRTIDEREMAFSRVVARYYPTVEVVIPRLEGTAERLARSTVGLRAIDVRTLAARIEEESRLSLDLECVPAGEELRTSVPNPTATLEPPLLPVADAPAEQESPLPTEELAPAQPTATETPPLSTDGGPEAVPPGPSLHDAVRARMAGDDPRNTARRTPPGSPRVSPPAAAGSAPPAMSAADRPNLSPEEYDALLGEEGADSSTPETMDGNETEEDR